MWMWVREGRMKIVITVLVPFNVLYVNHIMHMTFFFRNAFQ